MFGALQTVDLPNGQCVYCLSRLEAKSAFHQVESYFKHGIAVKPDDVVVDVGANIGLFSLAVFERCQRQGQIYAFEPIPTTFRALARNIEPLASRVKAFQMGLAASPGRLTFYYYPNSPLSSTAYPDFDLQAEREQTIKRIDHDPLLARYRWLKQVPGWLLKAVLNTAIRFIHIGYPVKCPVTTLSAFLRNHAIARIDLLKIDAEKAELGILQGIEPSDWPKIRQLVVELHQGKNSLEPFRVLLETQGFKLTIEYELDAEESPYLTIYASR
jgi:31-O-methyltransferase